MRRLLGPLIAVVILIGVGFALGIAFSGSRPSAQSPAVTVLTVPVLITATTDPNATPLVRVITATPPPGVVVLPTGLLVTPEEGESTAAVDAPTLDPELFADAALAQTATALPENCILHTVAEGDTPFAIAESYGASGFDLMAINGLTEELAVGLQIGDVLIVPLPGCSLTAEDVAAQSSLASVDATEEATAEVTAESTAESTAVPTATVRPTLTLPPTAVNAQLEIVRIINPGDITAEGVEIRNNGAAVNLTGWTLMDGEDNVFTFPEQRLFTGGVVTVYTRIGTNTPILLYWGRNEAVWDEGDTVTLEDAVGTVQSSRRVE